jgi:hypothetical protein
MQAKPIRVTVGHIRRGRPRVDTVRVECSVPRKVYDRLLLAEKLSGVYHTRVAATVLTVWSSNITEVRGFGRQTSIRHLPPS